MDKSARKDCDQGHRGVRHLLRELLPEARLRRSTATFASCKPGASGVFFAEESIPRTIAVKVCWPVSRSDESFLHDGMIGLTKGEANLKLKAKKQEERAKRKVVKKTNDGAKGCRGSS